MKNTREPISNVAIGKTDITDFNFPFDRKYYTEKESEVNISEVVRRYMDITLYFFVNKYFEKIKTFIGDVFGAVCLEQEEKNISSTFDIKSKIQNIVGTEWVVKVNDTLEFSHPYLKTGEYKFTLIVSNENETVEFLLYTSSNPKFETEIATYHKLASCMLIKDNYKFKIYHTRNFYLFLPFYPCWNDYSNKEKEMIKKIFNE